jgi:hypothetical protein
LPELSRPPDEATHGYKRTRIHATRLVATHIDAGNKRA